MKNEIFFMVFMLFLAPFVSALELNYSNTNIDSQYADIYVSVLKYEPFPVAPGEYFTLWLKIENKGELDAPDVTFRLKPAYPFYLDASDAEERHIGEISAHQSALVSYKVRVDENAVEGDSYLHYAYQTAKNKNPVENNILVRVQTPDSILSVSSVKTEPSTIAPGEKSNIQIDLKNSADSYLRYITVSLGLYVPITTAAGTSYTELPFTPVGEGSGKTIYQLAPKEEKTLNFTIVANPDAESKPYKIPLQIGYYDETGKNYSRNEILGVVVGSEPELYSIIETENVYSKGVTSELPIKFVNKGTGEIKFLNVKLEQSDNYKIISADTYYIGKIDSDDYDTATFKVNIQKIKNRKVEIPISYSYRDANNNKYSRNETVTLEVHSAGELGKGGGGSGWAIFFAIIIILVVYWRYKKWAKHKKKRA